MKTQKQIEQRLKELNYKIEHADKVFSNHPLPFASLRRVKARREEILWVLDQKNQEEEDELDN